MIVLSAPNHHVHCIGPLLKAINIAFIFPVTVCQEMYNERVCVLLECSFKIPRKHVLSAPNHHVHYVLSVSNIL